MNDDPRQVLSLLWHRTADTVRRGPKQRVSVAELVRAGIAIADEHGLARVSIRSVADAVGIRPMSVYTYLPSKDALIALMVDAVAGEDSEIPDRLGLRERLRAIAGQYRDELLRHPWLSEVPAWRPVLGPHLAHRYERHLRVLAEVTDVSDVELDTIVAALRAFAVGSARMSLDQRRTRAESGITDAQWWAVHGPLLTELITPAEFPVSTRVGGTVGELDQAPGNADRVYEFGLARLLDGIVAAAST